MIKITFPDGSVREFAKGTTAFQIAESISPRLAADSLAASVNGATVDMMRPIEEDASVKFYKWEDEEGKHAFWHTSSHLLAEALEALYPGIKFGIGPAIENGFYYDVDSPTPITEADLPKIEQKMQELSRNKEQLIRREVPKAEALKTFTEKGDQYKVELITDLQDGTISFYTNGAFTDLCRGPHIPNTGYIKALKLTSVAGAYWRGNEKNKMLTRIYGISFPKKSMLDEYLVMMEEAKKRDHRKLGKELGLFALLEEGPGFPFFLPKGMVLKNTLIDYWRQVHKKWNYVEISTPQIMKRTLWETSGHWDHYKDNMYTTVIDGEDFAIKPMNCPGSILVYELEPHSYRDLPLRYGELGLVHRHELSGALHGMFRVRCFTQDDAHILLAKDQIKDEVIRIARLFDEVYSLFGLPYKIELSTMPEDHIGTREDWEKAENALADAITSIGKEYVVNPGDGAFYGPKLDFHIQDSLGRTWQCGTIQLDYQLPGRFDLEYTTSDGGKDVPVMIHRVVFGSIERFIGIITEHFAGAFPAWLAPVQVKILPVTDRALDYAKDLSDALDGQGFRVEVDDRNEKIGKKIREATLEKVPYMIVVGDRDMENKTVSVRTRAGEDLGAMSLEDFTAKLKEVVDSKVIQ